VGTFGTLAGLAFAALLERVAELHRPGWFRAEQPSTSRPSA
jgi:hypothetical protein